MGKAWAYYSDNDPFAAAWLRELIKAGLIAPGEVDERSIEDIIPTDLAGFTQCHFFAGVGVWSFSLRKAGWPDSRAVWSGSCPCQPFSAAGKGVGFADERHLWPAWFHLIEQCKPDVIFGEQVSSKDGLAWFDLVSSDLENAGYTVGAGDICAASVGAPHIRQRLFFVADPQREPGRSKHEHEPRWRRSSEEEHGAESWRGREVDRLANSESDNRRAQFQTSGAASRRARPSGNGATRELGHTFIERLEGHAGNGNDRHEPGQPGPVNGFWRDAEWLRCRDGKSRPAKPDTPVLVAGFTNRVGLLRGFGNAINAEVAKAFIEAYMSLERI